MRRPRVVGTAAWMLAGLTYAGSLSCHKSGVAEPSWWTSQETVLAPASAHGPSPAQTVAGSTGGARDVGESVFLATWVGALAFLRSERTSGQLRLVVVDPASGHETQVPGVMCSGEASDMEWSYDGSRLAFTGADGNLWVVGEGEWPPRRVTGFTAWDSCEAVRPSWSPDGSEIAFQVDGGERETALPSSVRIVDLRTGDIQIAVSTPDPERYIGEPFVEYGHPAVSPDGSRIAFVTSRQRGRLPGPVAAVADVCLVGRNGGRIEVLTGGTGIYAEPTWAPDGAKLAYRQDHENGESGLCTMEVSSRHASELYRAAGPIRGICWSPDGDMLAFQVGEDPSSRVWVVRPDGSGRRPILGGAMASTHPTWDESGGKLAVSVERDGECAVAVVDLHQGSVELVGQSPDSELAPTWSRRRGVVRNEGKPPAP